MTSKQALTLLFAASTLFLMGATHAQADGLLCVGQQTAIQVKLYNMTAPSAGTRNPAILILSDPFVRVPNKTIASFKGKHSPLFAGNGIYEVTLDFEKNTTLNKDKNIAGTTLGSLKKISIMTDFNYANPVPHGAKVKGKIRYSKIDGEVLSENLDCNRYLKNSQNDPNH